MREDLSLRCPSCGGQAMFGATKLAMGPYDVIPCMKCKASLMLHRRQILACIGFFQLMMIVASVYSDDTILIGLLFLLLGFVFLFRWVRHRVRFVILPQAAPASQPQVIGWRARVAARPSPSLRLLVYQGIALLLLFVAPLTIILSTFIWPRGALPEWIGAGQHVVAAAIASWATGAIAQARR